MRQKRRLGYSKFLATVITVVVVILGLMVVESLVGF